MGVVWSACDSQDLGYTVPMCCHSVSLEQPDCSLIPKMKDAATARRMIRKCVCGKGGGWQTCDVNNLLGAGLYLRSSRPHDGFIGGGGLANM